VRWLAAAALSCAGCDQLFGFDHVPAQTDATDCAAIGPDEDGDCVPDKQDNCPATPNADQADVRETVPDGVGDACDPHLTQEGDTILAFYSFLGDPATIAANWPNEDPSSTTWSYPGDGTVVHTSLTDTIGELQSSNSFAGVDTTIEVGFIFHTFADQTTGPRLTAWLDSPLLNVGGHECWVQPFHNANPAADLAYVEDVAGNTHSAEVPELHDGDHVKIRLERVFGATDTLVCHVQVGDRGVDLPTVSATAWPMNSTDNHAAFSAIRSAADATYVIVYGPSL